MAGISHIFIVFFEEWIAVHKSISKFNFLGCLRIVELLQPLAILSVKLMLASQSIMNIILKNSTGLPRKCYFQKSLGSNPCYAWKKSQAFYCCSDQILLNGAS